MASPAATAPPLPSLTLLTPAAPPPRLPSRRSTRVGASRRTQPPQPVPLTKPPARRQQPPPLAAYRAPSGAAVATCAACLVRPRRGAGCHVNIGANGATPTATRAASRFAAAGFPPGAAAPAFPPPLPACGGADAAGDRGRRAWPVAAMQPALVASPGAHDTPESPCLGIAAPPPPLFRAPPTPPSEGRFGAEHPASAASLLSPAPSPPVTAADGHPVSHVCADALQARSRADARWRPPPTTSAGATSACVPGPPPPPQVGAAQTAAPAGNDNATPARRLPVGSGAAGTLPAPPAAASLPHAPRSPPAGAAAALSAMRPPGAAAAARAAPHGHTAPASAPSPAPARAS